MAVTAMAGAIASSNTTKPLGQLTTGIGWSHLWANNYLPAGMEANETPLEYHIGIASGDPIYDVGPVASKQLKFVQATAGVAIDAVVVTGWLNKTGRALVTGDWVMAVAA